jgi:uncharacterized protein YhfF
VRKLIGTDLGVYHARVDAPITFRGMQVIGFAFPGSELRRELVDLVLAGTKTATAGLAVELELDNETMPTPGFREAVVDAEDRIVAVIETTECRVVRMADVDDQFARDEGEGFADAAEWRAAHERFWSGYIGELRERLGNPEFSLTDNTAVICQRFRLVDRYPEPMPLSGGASPA